MRRSLWVRIGLLALVAICPALLAADAGPKPFLHSLFSSNMVLQRGITDPIWGWTDPGTTVTVSLNGKTATANSSTSVSASSTVTAGADGKWMAKLGPFEAGGPYDLTVSAGNKQEKLTNVLIGDVWLCSGQSNMSMGIGVAGNAQNEIAGADHPQLRLYTVPNIIAGQPQDVLQPRPDWQVCTPKSVSQNGWGGFSAAAYYFGRDLQKSLNVPIGLIHSSWGGTICEAWVSADALEKNMPDFHDALLQQQAQSSPDHKESYAVLMDRWYEKNDPGTPAGWQKPDAADSDWKTMKLPTYWEVAHVGMDNFDGVVWFRREVDIPPQFVGKNLILHLGPVDDRDTTWVNGTRVGGMDVYTLPRNYDVPASATQSAKALVAVRVLDTGGNGGIWGQPSDMRLEAPGSGLPQVDISGDWKYKPSTELKSAGPLPTPPGDNPNVVTVLYNGMINPLIPFGIKGAIWYQGESNAGRGMQYRRLLPTMIRDWRSRFGVGDFPFFIVQLANFQDAKPQPTESAWAELREAQSIVGNTVGNSAIASAIDIGEAGDIHPKNKQEVGHRLALDALATVYGQQVEYSGPQFKSMEKKDNTIVLHFTHADGLAAKAGTLKGFAISGPDHHFIWADAKIDGQSVVVSSPQINDPAAVRYDWADNPDGTLYNAAGLPATPFRTDSP
jgi:sialate O-acetylesterase